jgi:hypothetical protein
MIYCIPKINKERKTERKKRHKHTFIAFGFDAMFGLKKNFMPAKREPIYNSGTGQHDGRLHSK